MKETQGFYHIILQLFSLLRYRVSMVDRQQKPFAVSKGQNGIFYKLQGSDVHGHGSLELHPNHPAKPIKI